MKNQDDAIFQVEKELVLERIKALSDDVVVSVGSSQLNKIELISNVELGNEIGQDIIKAQIMFLKAMASGEIYNYV